MMMWLIQFLIAWFADPLNLNLCFVALCVAGALGAKPAPVFWLSAALYALFAAVPEAEVSCVAQLPRLSDAG